MDGKGATNAGRAGEVPIWIPALKVGAACGVGGFVIGGTAGIIRTSTPGLFAAASGIQCLALGTSFWAIRASVLHAWDVGNITQRDRVYASTIAGGLSGGTVAALTRGRANIVPGIIMFSIFGYLGQQAYNYVDEKPAPQEPKENIFKRFADLKWTPVRSLSDAEYEDMLQEKLLKVNAEIALIDDRIEVLRKETQQKPVPAPSQIEHEKR
ncbi:hypothetical protein LTS18_009324 [Coniosporium uncinatum]|uniref:Uncharacterized protein n=1 Tax=Coniosporium uncinatum TaxID=93489 RepID=A0ACC3DMP1_9PEZI|nr:hypothetical protein LTS18_009324 [Coniosporium uncinatum]